MTQEEHKFKAGDWIKEKSTSRTLRVLEVMEGGYRTNLANYNRIQFSVERYFKKIEPPKEYEKLLYQDLCARIPYGVKVEVADDNGGFSANKPVRLLRGGTFDNEQNYFITTRYGLAYKVNELLPYLRPLSSMTKEECDELKQIMKCDAVTDDSLQYAVGGCVDYDDFLVYYEDSYKLNDWLNKNMFDYRGLIPKGLANAALDGMYNN